MVRRGRVLLAVLACVAAFSIGGVAAAAPALDARPARALPEHAHLYVIGDSWAAGLFADPDETFVQVAANALGWSADVNAVSGTGFVNAAGTPGQDYVSRARAIPSGTTADVVLVQGGSNDDGDSLTAISAAVDNTIQALRARFPTARIVFVGPGPDPAPVTSEQTAVDRTIEHAAEAKSVPYISMLAAHWITNENLDAIIDSSNHHPTVVGDAYLGGRLADALLRVLAIGRATTPGHASTSHPRG